MFPAGRGYGRVRHLMGGGIMQERKVRLQVYVDQSVMADIDRIAYAVGQTRSECIAVFLRDYISGVKSTDIWPLIEKINKGRAAENEKTARG